LTKRSGFFRNAISRTGGVNRVGLAVVNPIWRHEADTGVVMVLIVPGEEVPAKRLGVLDTAESLGKFGRYFKVLKWLSENGLSFEAWGRLCDLVTPRSASIWAVALAFMGAPRSACRVIWPGGT